MRVLVTVPCWDGWIKNQLVEPLMEYAFDRRHKKTICFVRGRPLEEALNRAAHMVTGGYEKVKDSVKICFSDIEDFENGYDAWLVIDADNIPTANFLDLAEYEKDVLFAPYPIYQHYTQGENPCRWGVICDNPTNKGLQEVEAGASGSMMVARGVIEKLPQPIFERAYSTEDGHVTRGVDYRFCDKVKGAGFKTWVHWGYRSFHFQEVELLSAVLGFQNYWQGKK